MLLSELQKTVDVQTKLPPPIQGMTTAHVIDVMATVQMLQTGGASNLDELAARHYDLIVAPLGRNGCIRVENKLRYIPMHNVAAKLGPQLCDALPEFHALTGCDSNSSMFGIGKKQAFKTLCRSDFHQTSVSQLSCDTLV